MSSTASSSSSKKARRQTITWILAVVVFIVAITGTVVGALWYHAQQITVSPAPEVHERARVLKVAEPSLDDASLTTQVAAIMEGAAKDPRLGELHALVSNGITGKELWSQGADDPAVPASSMKMLTSAAALLQLPHNDRVTTKVLRYGQSNDVILVGAGDPTLSKDGHGFYTDAASLANLAKQVAAAVPEGVGKVYVDNSLFPETFHESWDKAGLKDGYVAPVDSVAIDAGRINPDQDESQRQEEPAVEAGNALAAALGAQPGGLIEGTPVDSSEVLGKVASAPLITRVRDMMQHSDNVLAESIAREVALSKSLPPTYQGAAEAVRKVLVENGFNLDGAVLADSSGLSTDNRLTPHHLEQVLNAAAAPSASDKSTDNGENGANPVTAKLRPLLDTLPVGGVSGTLAGRYDANPGAGWVRAKTGTLDGTSALAGYVVTASGEVLTFVMLSNGASVLPARAAADSVAGQLSQI